MKQHPSSPLRLALVVGTAFGLARSSVAVDYTWDGTNNNWNTAHWLPGPVAGPTSAGHTATINGGTVTFSGNDTYGYAGTTSSPTITINTGGTLASGGFFTTLWNLNLGGGTLLANGGVNGTYPAFQVAGTLSATTGGASAISVGGGSNNMINIGGQGNATLTMQVADVTGSSATDLTIDNVLQNSQIVGGTQAGNLTKTGAGTLQLTAANTYTGATSINDGTLLLSGGANRLSTSGAISIGASGTLDLGGNSQTTTGVFTFASGGTLKNGTLTDNNAAIAGNNAITGTIHLGSGGAFVTNRRLLLANGGTGSLTLSNTSTGSLTFGGDNGSNENYVGVGGGAATFTVNGGTVNFNNASSGAGNGYLNIGSNSNSSNGSVVVNGGNINVGTWMKLGGNYNSNQGSNATSAMSITSGTVTVGGGPDGGYNGVLFLNGGGGDVTSNSGTATMTLNTGGVLQVKGVESGNYGTKTINFDGGTLRAGASSTTFMYAASGFSLKVGNGGANIDTQAYDITVAPALVTNGTGGLAKSGGGVLTLTGVNTYTGGTAINDGVLALSSSGTISTSSTITIGNGATLRLSRHDTWGAHNSTTSSPIVVNAGGTLASNNTFNTLVNPTLAGGTLLLNGGALPAFPAFAIKGTLTVSGSTASNINVGSGSNNLINIGSNVAGGVTTFDVGDVTLSAAADLTINAPLKNNMNVAGNAEVASGLTKTGSGTLLVAGNSTYTGATTVSTGTLKAGIATVGGASPSSGAFGINSALTLNGGATLDLAGFNQTVGSLADNAGSGGAVTSSAAGAITFITGGNNTSTAFAGTLQNGSATSLGLTKTGTGRQILTGGNSYTGTTTISTAGGALQANDGAGLPSVSFLSLDGGVLQSNGATTFTRSLAASGSSKLQFTANGGGFSANGGQLTVNLGGASAEQVWGTTVGTELVGTLRFGSATANGKTLFQNGIDLNGANRAVIVTAGAGGDSAEMSGVIRTSSGTAGLSKSGTGTLLLSNDNTFNGALGVSGGTVVLGGALGAVNASSGVAISGGGTLQLDNTTINGNRLNNAGTVTMTTGTLNYSHSAGAVNYSETTGALSVSGGANFVSSSRAAVGQTSTLNFASLSYAGGANSLQFSGSGLGLSDGRNRIYIGGSVPLTGGVIGGNAVYFDGVTTGQAGYSVANGVVLYSPATNINVRGGVIPDNDSSIGIVQAGASGNITLSAPVITIQSLTQNATSAGTVDLAGGTIKINNVVIGSALAPLTIGVTPNNGTIMSNTSGGNLSLNNNYGTPLTVNSMIADNATSSSLTKTGSGAVNLAGSATYTGATEITSGTLALVGAGSLSDVTAVNLSGATSVLDLSAIGATGETIGSLGGVSGSSVVLAGKHLALNGAAPSPFAGVISGGGSSLTLLAGSAQTLTGGNSFTGHVTIGTNASLTVDRIQISGSQPLGQASSAITFQGNASQGSTLVYSGTGAGSTNRGLDMASGLGGTVNVSQTAAVLTVNGALTGGFDFHKAGPGTLVLTASDDWSGNGSVEGGALVIGGQSGAGSNSITGGNWDVAGGATLRVNTSGSFEASTISRTGTFHLEAGTLRTNSIAGTGAFVWGGATLATLGNNTMGTVDRTDPAGASSGPTVKEGNILNYTGDLASATTPGLLSVLDLGAPQRNDGLRYNQIKVSGTLDLTGVDTLRFDINPYFLRPTSPNSVITGDWGTLILAYADTITGTFDNITGIGGDSIGWSGSIGNTPTNPAGLALNSYYIEYRTGYGPLSGGYAILFHYKVAGSVPEPASAGLLFGGVVLLRALVRSPKK